MSLPDHLKILMGSKKTDWPTPGELYDPVNDLFNFTLDVCAEKGNTKCKKFISPDENSFVTPWVNKGRSSGSAMCWMNPPYGKSENPCKDPHEKCTKKKCKERGFHVSEYIPGIGDWVDRAHEQSVNECATVVCLLPARTDTYWFQTVWTHAKLICFARGRFKFVGADSGATFPNVIAVFAPEDLDNDKYEGMTSIGNVVDLREGQLLIYGGKKNG